MQPLRSSTSGSAKSETHYAEIVDKIESEREIDRFLYLASSEQGPALRVLAVPQQQAACLLWVSR